GKPDSVKETTTFSYVYLNPNINLTAEAVPQQVVLGEEIPFQKAKELVTNVRLGERVLQPDEYEVEIVEKEDTHKIENQQMKIRVKVINTEIFTEMDVPIKVNWGHTLGSNNVIKKGKTGFAISLLTDKDKPSLVSTLGFGSSRYWINDFRNGTYIQVDLFDASTASVTLNGSIPYYSEKVHGRESILTAAARWNLEAPHNQMNYGDVLRYDVRPDWGDNKWIFREEEQRFESNGIRDIYYEITKDGYRLLHVNQLIPKTIYVKNGASEEEMNQKLQESIDL
ncbi:hypothetical protein, partial [Bacillus cereus]|uniref:hypothetical protein n=1 Tax=Bacillus cereus TaxID=1396 RepID=UPI000BFB0470